MHRGESGDDDVTVQLSLFLSRPRPLIPHWVTKYLLLITFLGQVSTFTTEWLSHDLSHDIIQCVSLFHCGHQTHPVVCR